MTYKIIEHSDEWELKNGDGESIATGDYPLRTPDDIIEAILDDMGVGKPQRQAFGVLFRRDWEFINEQS